MKAMLILCVFGVLFIGCDFNSHNAEKLGLVCMNGKVFKKEHTNYFIAGKTELIPLGVECPSGKIEIK